MSDQLFWALVLSLLAPQDIAARVVERMRGIRGVGGVCVATYIVHPNPLRRKPRLIGPFPPKLVLGTVRGVGAPATMDNSPAINFNKIRIDDGAVIDTIRPGKPGAANRPATNLLDDARS